MGTFGELIITLWIPICILIFCFAEVKQAILIALVTGWLFLPVFNIRFEGLPDINKVNLTSGGVLIGASLFAFHEFFRFRFRWFDLFAIAWCFCPIPSSLVNKLGFYDGISASVEIFLMWGIPYLIGRIFFSDLRSRKSLVLALFIGGVIYLPFCLYEMRMSPQLHNMVYGYFPGQFGQTSRLGGWRPQVFMQHGLMLGMWMASAAVLGVWLFRKGVLQGVFWQFVVVCLVGTAILCRSAFAILLAIGATLVLFLSEKIRSRILISLLVAIPIAYMAVRTSQIWSGSDLVTTAYKIFGADRAQSISFRLFNENLLIRKALDQPVFGWGGWGRNLVSVSEHSDKKTITDGLWIIAFGQHGIVGLAALFLMIFMSILRLHYYYPVARWDEPDVAPSVALSLVVAIFAIDCLLNSMINPVMIVAIGGLTGQKSETPSSVSVTHPQHLEWSFQDNQKVEA